MKDLQISEILSKTNIYITICDLIQSCVNQNPPKYKPLILQIININTQNETIALSDSLNAFTFHINPTILSNFKNNINKYMIITKLIGSIVKISEWNLDYFLVGNSHKFDIKLNILKMSYLDSFGNEYIEGKKTFGTETHDFVIDISKPDNLNNKNTLRNLLWKLRKNLIREKYRKMHENHQKCNAAFYLNQQLQEKNDIAEEQINIYPVPVPIQDQDQDQGKQKIIEKNNMKTVILNNHKNKIIAKKNNYLDNIKLVYDNEELLKVYGEKSHANSVFSDLESIKYDSEAENSIIPIDLENFESNNKILMTENKKRKEAFEIDRTYLKKIKQNENESKNVSLSDIRFTMDQIQKIKQIFDF